MARKKASTARDIVEIIATFPWWVGIALAAVAYIGLHWVASWQIAPPRSGQGMGGFAGAQLIHVLATFGQYVLPGLFLVGSALSATANWNRRSGEGQALPAGKPPRGVRETAGTSVLPPAVRSQNLYELWKSNASTVPSRADQWSLELLRVIDWKRFEEVCAEYFRVCGFHAETQSHGPDGGVDVTLYAPRDRTSIANIVQCKQWSRPVGPKPLRELLGVMTAKGVARGTFVTASTFNEQAESFAAENRIHLIDGAGLLKRILDRSPEDQQRLLRVATEGDYLTPSCPSCGTKLVRRENKKDQSVFWGCGNFPRCRYTLKA